MAGLAYVSLEEAAELEGIKYNTLVQRIRRNTSSYDTKAETRDSGGKEMTLVAVNSLSKLGQNREAERDGRDGSRSSGRGDKGTGSLVRQCRL